MDRNASLALIRQKSTEVAIYLTMIISTLVVIATGFIRNPLNTHSSLHARRFSALFMIVIVFSFTTTAMFFLLQEGLANGMMQWFLMLNPIIRIIKVNR